MSAKASTKALPTSSSGKQPQRSVQEQLRVDHIEVLAENSRLSRDNAALEKEIAQLRLSLGNSTQSSDSSSQQELLLELKKFRDSNAVLSNELSRMKDQMRKMAVEEKAKYQEQFSQATGEFTQQIQKLREMMSNLEAQNQTLSISIQASNQNSDASLSDLQRQCQQLLQQVGTLEKTIGDRDCSLDNMQTELEKLKLQSRTMQAAHTDAVLQISSLQRQRDDLTDQLATSNFELDKRNAFVIKLEQEAEDLHLKLKSTLESNNKLQLLIDQERTEWKLSKKQRQACQYSDSDSDDEIPASILISSVQQTCMSTQTDLSSLHVPLIPEPSAESDEDSMHSQSVRFQEFLRLKRENRELKLRLVEKGGNGSEALQPPIGAKRRATGKAAMSGNQSAPPNTILMQRSASNPIGILPRIPL